MKCFRKDIAIVNMIFFLYKTGESMLDATTRPYILRAVCNHNYPDNSTFCDNIREYPDVEDYMQKQSGFFLICYRVIMNVPAVILGLFCGAFSDKHGRKIPMLLPSIGSVCGVTFYIISLFFREFQLLMILIGACVQGMFGKSTIITMAVNSYISDITEKHERIRKIGNLLAISFFGMFFGSFLSGIIQDTTNLLITYSVVVLLHGSTVILTALCLKESISVAKLSDEGSFGSSCKIGSLFNPSNVKESIEVLTKKRQNNGRTIVLLMFLLTLFNQICKVGEMDVTILFVTRSPLSWPKSWYGYLLSLDFAVMGFCLLFILPILSTYLKLNDAAILMIAIGCKVVRLSWAAFATVSWMVFASVAIGGFAGMISSAVRSLVSKSVSDHEAGKLFSLLACTETASKVFGVLSFVNLYSMTADYFAGIAFLTEAMVYLVMLLIVLFIYKSLKIISKHEYVIGDEDEQEDLIYDKSETYGSSTNEYED